MNKKQTFIVIYLTFIFNSSVFAQFNTIVFNESKRVVERSDTFRLDTLPSVRRNEPGYAGVKGLSVDIYDNRDMPIYVNVTDSLLLGLLTQRCDVCLPLDMLTKTSSYGVRQDPVVRCQKFHDGIDLRCNMQYVYSMMPGTIKKVVYSNKGYGNHVIISHGDVDCLYGHLYMSTVKEGDMIPAGYVVGISGNTGKTTGPHLHIRMTYRGKSIDPEPFIKYLNRYISSLQDKIDYLQTGGTGTLTIGNLYRALDRYNVQHKQVVLAQALLETGYFTSRVCQENKNLFGLRRPSDGSYYEFDKWEDSVKAYRDYVQYKYKGGDYYEFLDRIGYAEDKEYVTKVRSIARTL